MVWQQDRAHHDSGGHHRISDPDPQLQAKWDYNRAGRRVVVRRNAASNIGRITTSGSVTEYPVAAPNSSITTGPDGALWFTEFGGNKIGRITIGGAVTE